MRDRDPQPEPQILADRRSMEEGPAILDWISMTVGFIHLPGEG